MDGIFETTDEELAHVIRAAQAAAAQDVVERTERWVYDHCDLAEGHTLRFTRDASPHELLEVLRGGRA